MNKNKLIEIVKEILREQFSTNEDKINNIVLNTDIILDLNGDELDIVEIVMEIEDRLEICLDEKPFDKQIEKDKRMTVRAFINLICEQIGVETQEFTRFDLMDI